MALQALRGQDRPSQQTSHCWAQNLRSSPPCCLDKPPDVTGIGQDAYFKLIHSALARRDMGQCLLCPMGGLVPGSSAVTYSPGPQCCQLLSQGSCFLGYFITTARSSLRLYRPTVQIPLASALTSMKPQPWRRP